MFKKKTSKYNMNSKIKILQDIVDEQNKELANLRMVAKNYEEFIKQKENMDKMVQEHIKLCAELRQEKKEYEQLNKEFKAMIAHCKQDLDKVIENAK